MSATQVRAEQNEAALGTREGSKRDPSQSPAGSHALCCSGIKSQRFTHSSSENLIKECHLLSKRTCNFCLSRIVTVPSHRCETSPVPPPLLSLCGNRVPDLVTHHHQSPWMENFVLHLSWRGFPPKEKFSSLDLWSPSVKAPTFNIRAEAQHVESEASPQTFRPEHF